jgi:hypothetical protein
LRAVHNRAAVDERGSVLMTWLEIKEAAERVGIKENDEIVQIEIETRYLIFIFGAQSETEGRSRVAPRLQAT